MALTPKRQRFVEEYLVDLKATQAAIRAGFAPSGASVEGARLLRNAKVGGARTGSISSKARR
jgi:phage terminase small subunit